MLRALTAFFGQGSAAVPLPATRERELALATAVLLIEVVRADFSEAELEIAAVGRLLEQHLGISPAEADSLMAEARREADGAGWFEVWLIPETLRMTTFGDKRVGDAFNIEIERQTQVIVDTVREAVAERLGPYLGLLDALARERGVDIGRG